MKWLKDLLAGRRDRTPHRAVPSKGAGSEADRIAASLGSVRDDQTKPQRTDYDDNPAGSSLSFVEGGEEKFEAGTLVLIARSCDLQSCKGELSALGFSPPDMLRLSALVPVACGRRIFSKERPGPKYSAFYIVTNFGRSRLEIPYATCPVYAGIQRALDQVSQAQITLVGALACETQSINDVLNRLRDNGRPVDLSVVTVYPVEVQC